MKKFLEQEPMKYWAPPTKNPEKYKEKVRNALDSGEYIASIKKDGEWERFVKTEDGEMFLQGRGISKVTGTHLNKIGHVPHLMDFFNKLPNGTVFLGELYFPSGNSNDVSSILRCLEKKAVARQEEEYGLLSYYIFDILAFDGEDYSTLPFLGRVQFLELLRGAEKYKNAFVEFAEFNYINNYEEIEKLANEAFTNDEEGLVCMKKNLPYSPGKRTAWSSIKIKRESNELDVICTAILDPTVVYTGKEEGSWPYWAGITETISEEQKCVMYSNLPIGNHGPRTDSCVPVTKNYYYDMPSAIEISAYKNGEFVSLGKVASGLDEKLKIDLGKNPDKYLNKPCVVTCMNVTEDNKLRHPRFIKFRNDIDAEDCTLDKIVGSS